MNYLIFLVVDSSSKSQANSQDAWNSFSGLCEAFMRLFGLISQLVFISQQKSGGTIFTLVAVVRPVMTLVGERTLWLKRESFYGIKFLFQKPLTAPPIPQHMSRTRTMRRISDFSRSRTCLRRSSGAM
jgi:hypothetical protein